MRPAFTTLPGASAQFGGPGNPRQVIGRDKGAELSPRLAESQCDQQKQRTTQVIVTIAAYAAQL
jgi:hypothetical protein